MHKFILILVTSCICLTGYAQTEEQKIQQLLRDQEQARTSEIMRTLDQGVDLMNNENFEAADAKFKKVLKGSKVVPTDLCFYFGKNSFHLGKYQQSIDWLNKYIQLRGTTGQYSDECVEYLKKANEAFVLMRQDERKDAESILTSNYDIDCGPSGKVICPVCEGKGVIITKGAFGDHYKSCPYSDKHGYLTCEEYNKLLRGTLDPEF